MPFIVQCPHPSCRKYMLLEDSARGAKVECLLCKKSIAVDPSGSRERPKMPPLKPTTSGPPPPPPPLVERQRVVNCPKCDALLRPPPAGEGLTIKCPRCKHVFTP